MKSCVKCGSDVPDKTGFGVCFIYGPHAPPALSQEGEYAVICDACGNGKNSEEMLAMVPLRVTQKAIREESQKSFEQ